MDMKRMKWITLVLVLILALSMTIMGCQPERPPDDSSDSSQPTASDSTEPAPPETSEPAPSDTTAVDPNMRTFTDSTGREVTIPMRLSRIAPTGPLAQIVLYTAAPELLCGTAQPFTDTQLKLIGEKYGDLPAFGQFYGKSGDFNLEAVLATGAEVIIDIGEAKKTIKEDMDNMQAQINIPVVFIEATFAGMPKAYRDLGELLGDNTRTEMLAQYCEETLALCERAKAEIPHDKRPKVYWAMGELGLNTNAAGSFHSEIFDYVPIINVADVEASSKGGGSEVSMEQIIKWNPDFIIVEGNALAEVMKNDPAWHVLDAVKNGMCGIVPTVPYNFMGFPPSVNRYLGVRMTGAGFYPEIYGDSQQQVVKDFFKLFYNIEVDDAQLDKILSGTFE